jgi:hypothetical protein
MSYGTINQPINHIDQSGQRNLFYGQESFGVVLAVRSEGAQENLFVEAEALQHFHG